jgi:hypothetical protein
MYEIDVGKRKVQNGLKLSSNIRKRLHIVTVTIFKEYLIVTVTKFRK